MTTIPDPVSLPQSPEKTPSPPPPLTKMTTFRMILDPLPTLITEQNSVVRAFKCKYCPMFSNLFRGQDAYLLHMKTHKLHSPGEPDYKDQACQTDPVHIIEYNKQTLGHEILPPQPQVPIPPSSPESADDAPEPMEMDSADSEIESDVEEPEDQELSETDREAEWEEILSIFLKQIAAPDLPDEEDAGANEPNANLNPIDNNHAGANEVFDEEISVDKIRAEEAQVLLEKVITEEAIPGKSEVVKETVCAEESEFGLEKAINAEVESGGALAKQVEVNKPIDNGTNVDEPTSEEPVVDEPPAEEPVVDEPPAEEPVVDEPPADDPGFDEPLAEEPVVDEPPAEEAEDVDIEAIDEDDDPSDDDENNDPNSDLSVHGESDAENTESMRPFPVRQREGLMQVMKMQTVSSDEEVDIEGAQQEDPAELEARRSFWIPKLAKSFKEAETRGAEAESELREPAHEVESCPLDQLREIPSTAPALTEVQIPELENNPEPYESSISSDPSPEQLNVTPKTIISETSATPKTPPIWIQLSPVPSTSTSDSDSSSPSPRNPQLFEFLTPSTSTDLGLRTPSDSIPSTSNHTSPKPMKSILKKHSSSQEPSTSSPLATPSPNQRKRKRGRPSSAQPGTGSVGAPGKLVTNCRFCETLLPTPISNSPIRNPKGVLCFYPESCDSCSTEFSHIFARVVNQYKSKAKIFKCSDCGHETRQKAQILPHLVRHKNPNFRIRAGGADCVIVYESESISKKPKMSPETRVKVEPVETTIQAESPTSAEIPSPPTAPEQNLATATPPNPRAVRIKSEPREQPSEDSENGQTVQAEPENMDSGPVQTPIPPARSRYKRYKVFQCPQCPRKLGTTHELQAHLRAHAVQRTWMHLHK